MAKIKKIQEGGETIYPATITNAIKDVESGATLAEILENKANVDGTYPEMEVGAAYDVINDGSFTSEEISFRPSGGTNRNVKVNGVARIEKIKGNSVVWNSKIRNELSTKNEGLDGWYVRQGQANAVIDGDTIKYTFAQLNGGSQVPQVSQYIGFTINHKYLIDWKYDYPDEVFTLESNNVIRFNSSIDKLGNKNTYIYEILQGSSPKGRFQKIWACDVEGQPFIYTSLARFNNLNNIGLSASHTVKIFDLTKMFGAGNEPTTVEEFYQRLPVGIDISEYNEGEIIDGNYGALKTTGFNQFDGEVERGYIFYNYNTGIAGENTGNNSITDFRSKNFIDVLPNHNYFIDLSHYDKTKATTVRLVFYDNDKNFISTTTTYTNWDKSKWKFQTPINCRYLRFYISLPIEEYKNTNINIAWDEYAFMNGMYQPYKPFTRDLSWVSKYFPNGMRSAGSVRDEIRFNSTTQKWEAVQNVGVRAYAEGDSEDTSVTTDGTNTNYALATPIVTEITEDINMDFNVSDYGTEELIAQEGKASAIFMADISYLNNTLSSIKQIPTLITKTDKAEDDIKNIKKEIDAIQEKNIEDDELEFYKAPNIEFIRPVAKDYNGYIGEEPKSIEEYIAGDYQIKISHPYYEKHKDECLLVIMKYGTLKRNINVPTLAENSKTYFKPRTKWNFFKGGLSGNDSILTINNTIDENGFVTIRNFVDKILSRGVLKWHNETYFIVSINYGDADDALGVEVKSYTDSYDSPSSVDFITNYHMEYLFLNKSQKKQKFGIAVIKTNPEFVDADKPMDINEQHNICWSNGKYRWLISDITPFKMHVNSPMTSDNTVNQHFISISK